MTEEVLTQNAFDPCVSSHGYGDSSIYFLAGFPSKDDLFNGLAISGQGEKTLNSFLTPNKLNLKQTYRSCFIKQRLDYSGTKAKPLAMALKKIDLEKYLDLLFSEIRDVNPNVIVPIDDVALSAVFPHINAIKKPKGRPGWIYCYRGSILPLRADFQSRLPNQIRVIPTLSPMHLNMDWTARSYVAIDFERIAANRNARSVITDVGKVWIARTYQEFSNFLERSLSVNPAFVTFDIETYCGIITCCSFCFDGFEAVSTPLNPYFYPNVSKVDMALNWQLICKLMRRELPKCGQNVKYDWTITERHGVRSINVIHDTMLKAALLYPELPKGLDFLTSIYTDIPYYKDEGKNYNPEIDNKDRLLLYNAKDSLATHIINVKQDEELEENGQKNLYYNEIAPLILIYKDIDETGILIDQDQKRKLLWKYSQMYEQNLSILRGLVGNFAFNAKSPVQVGTLIYEELRFPKRFHTNENGVKAYSSDKETLDDLMINYGDQNKLGKVGVQILSRVILCRKLAQVLTYINTALHPDGTFRGVSNLGGTETGRSSFSKSLDEIFFTQEEMDERKRNKKPFRTQQRCGRSLQTITKHGFKVDDELFDDPESSEIASDLRSMFIPRKGFIFIEGDGSQAEARAVAVLAEDYELLASFDQKPKCHAKTAAACFGGDANLITKDFPRHEKIGIALYDLGKRIRHAGHYAMGEFRLSQMTHLPLIESRIILTKFHQSNPKIQGIFHKDVDDAIRRPARELVTPFLRKRVFYDRLSESLYKQAKAQIPQSTISDQTKFTLSRIKEQVEGYRVKYRFLTEQHDGILAEVRSDYWEVYSEAFKRIYERPIDFRIGTLSRDFDLVIPAELSKSETNWMEMKEFKL